MFDLWMRRKLLNHCPIYQFEHFISESISAFRIFIFSFKVDSVEIGAERAFRNGKSKEKQKFGISILANN